MKNTDRIIWALIALVLVYGVAYVIPARLAEIEAVIDAREACITDTECERAWGEEASL